MIGNAERRTERDSKTGFNGCPGAGQTRTAEGLLPRFLSQETGRSFPKKARCGKQDHPERLFREKSWIDHPFHRQTSDPRRSEVNALPGKEQCEIQSTGPDSSNQINFPQLQFFLGYGNRITTVSAYTEILMQYETPLPDDFTMDQVRKRAVSVAPKFDEYPRG
jgi:hypothetical protein